MTDQLVVLTTILSEYWENGGDAAFEKFTDLENIFLA